MIEDPPNLTLRRRFPRPPAALVEALRGTPTGFVVDAMDGSGALAAPVKPLAGAPSALCGVALTSDNGPADNLALFASMAIAEPGDVLVAATGGFAGTAITGDLLLGMARNRFVAGFVTDGMVRDIPGIVAVGLPCFCAGVTPNSPVRNGPGTVGLPVVVGGVAIESGDVVVGDADGVVVVPRARLAAVVERLAAVRRAEAALDARVKGGLGVPEWLEALLASDRVREVE
jgi:4-hydroxy-4-methyl-2-oxoglutarate aldolase